MRRSYDKEFKMNAVKLSYSSGQKITVLEKELGIGRGNLNHWQREFKKSGDVAFPDKGNIKEENKENFDISKMCDILGVKPSSCFSWLSRSQSKRKQEDSILLSKIKEIYKNSKNL